MRAFAPPAARFLWKSVAGFCAAGFLSGVAPVRESAACTCIAVQDLSHAMATADAVFVGTVRGVSERPREQPGGGHALLFERIVHMEVLGKWKGTVAEEIQIRTGVSDADCGFPFELDESYLVFAHQDEGGLGTSLCSRTMPLGGAVEDILALGALGDPDR